MGKRKRIESDRELLDRLEKASKGTRLYGVIDYGIRKEFYRVMCGYTPSEQFDNYFPIGNTLSTRMMRAQYAVTEKLYKDCLKSLDGRMRERLGKLSFEFSRNDLDACLKNARMMGNLTKGDHSKMVAMARGERKPETREESLALKSYQRNIEMQSHRTVLFNAVEKICGKAEADKPFYKGTKVRFPVATVKSIKVVFDSGNESELFSPERRRYFEQFGYKYFPISKADIKKGYAEKLVKKYLSETSEAARLADIA